MKREYKKSEDKNSRNGAEKKTCPFYEEFNELYGNKSGTRPTYVMSTTCSSGSSQGSTQGLSQDTSSSSSSSSSEKSFLKKITKRKRADPTSLLKEYSKNQEQFKKYRL